MSKRWRLVTGIGVAVVLVLGAAGLWLQGKLDPSGPPGEAVRVEIPLGSSTGDIADRLADRGVVTSATIFRLYLRLRGGGPFQAGTYELRRSMSMREARAVLTRGPSLPPAQYLTIPEGLVMAQIAERVGRIEHLDADAFLALAAGGDVRSRFQPAGPTNLEGLLFPETYRIEEDEDEAVLLRRMVETFDAVAGEVGLDEAPARVGVSSYEAVVVASLVEAEAKSDEDRAKIARVIYNRLERGMPLGIDATFYYVLPLERRGTPLRRSELDRDGPYNTRLRRGLVPTPIMAPGRASLAAALAPEPGPWLYYVLKDRRTHAFTDDYQQFLRDRDTAREKGLL